MAKDNPIDVYRRQQRKKELKKNKTARIKARDAKVAATRSLEEVKSEISYLERKRDRNEEKSGLDNIETKKLERLQKELRIVKDESVKRKALAEQAQLERDKELLAAQKTVEGVQKLNESKYSLKERYASVYYDEQMNRFGAPAPGQMKLYYADVEGKTTTMDPRRAVVPTKFRKKFEQEGGKDDVILMQEDTARRKRRWDDQGNANQQQQMVMPPPMNNHYGPGHPQQHIPPSMPMPPQQPPHPPPPPPPPPPPMQPPLPPVPPPSTILPPPKPPIDKTKVPALPAPSKAVLRAAKRSSGSKRTNALADIWASQEEMEYESSLGGALEGTVDQQQQQQSFVPRWKRNKKNGKSSKEQADTYDPCCPSADGYSEYRDAEQIERQSKEVAKLKKEQNEHVAKHIAATTSQQHSSYDIQQPIWYYRDNTSNSVQGPFSGHQMLGWRPFFPPTTPVRFSDGSHFDFVPLSSVDFTNPPVPPPPPKETTVSAPDEAINSANNDTPKTAQVEATAPSLTTEDEIKLAIPKTEGVTEEQMADDNNVGPEPEVEMCLPPPSDDEDNHVDIDNNVNTNNSGQEVDMCLPPPSDDEEDDQANNDGEVDMCLPPPSDDEEENDQNELPYPSVGEYPLPNDDEAVYPVDVEYPVDNDYPDTGDSYNEGGELSAVAPYPTSEDVEFGVADEGTVDQQVGEQEVIPPPVEKKKYVGDKAVVGFLPSNLRVKRGQTKKKSATKDVLSTAEKANDKEDKQGKNSVADDYNKFMEEIAEIK